MKAERKAFIYSSCSYLASFSEVSTLLNAWSKLPKQLMQSFDQFFVDADAVQSISSGEYENNIIIIIARHLLAHLKFSMRLQHEAKN